MDWAADGSMCGITTKVRRFPGCYSECIKGAARPVITRGTSTRHNESDCTLGRTHLLHGVFGFDSTKHAMSLTLWHVCSCPGWLLARAVCNTGAGRCQRRRPRCRADLAAGTVKLRALPASSPDAVNVVPWCGRAQFMQGFTKCLLLELQPRSVVNTLTTQPPHPAGGQHLRCSGFARPHPGAQRHAACLRASVGPPAAAACSLDACAQQHAPGNSIRIRGATAQFDCDVPVLSCRVAPCILAWTAAVRQGVHIPYGRPPIAQHLLFRQLTCATYNMFTPAACLQLQA